MRILLVDTDGVGLDFALRCCGAGHEVRWWQPRERGEPTQNGDGMGVEKVDEWLEHIDWADLILPTMNDRHVNKLDALRAAGFPVFGPSMASRELEVSREAGMQLLEQHDIAIPQYRAFSGFDEAIAFVKKMDEPFVAKPLGDNPDKSLTYVAKSPEGLVDKLEGWKAEGKQIGRLMLQEKIEGEEMGVSRWMGASGFIGPPNESFEYKKLMPGNLGKNTGETGTVLKYVEKSKLYDTVLKPLERALRSLNHTGDIAINCIVNKKRGPLVLEFTCRLGWPFMFIVQALHRGDPAGWMRAALDGHDTLQVSKDVAVGFLMWITTDPEKPAAFAEGKPIYGLDEADMRQAHLVSVKWGEAWRRSAAGRIEKLPGLCTSGPYVLVISGHAPKVEPARESALKVLKKLDIPCDPSYREDIGDGRLGEKIATLQKQDFASEWMYR